MEYPTSNEFKNSNLLTFYPLHLTSACCAWLWVWETLSVSEERYVFVHLGGGIQGKAARRNRSSEHTD
jgi:hypothetical protein